MSLEAVLEARRARRRQRLRLVNFLSFGVVVYAAIVGLSKPFTWWHPVGAVFVPALLVLIHTETALKRPRK